MINATAILVLMRMRMVTLILQLVVMMKMSMMATVVTQNPTSIDPKAATSPPCEAAVHVDGPGPTDGESFSKQ